MKIDGPAVARRVYRIMVAVAGAGIVGAWMLWGAAGAWGFTLGSVISFGNAWWIHRVAMSIGPGGEKPGGASLIAVFRYLLMLRSVVASVYLESWPALLPDMVSVLHWFESPC